VVGGSEGAALAGEILGELAVLFFGLGKLAVLFIGLKTVLHSVLRDAAILCGLSFVRGDLRETSRLGTYWMCVWCLK